MLLAIPPETVGTIGPLDAPHVFHSQGGVIGISTDGGGTAGYFDLNPVGTNRDANALIIETGMTVSYKNDTSKIAVLHYMPLAPGS